jgi:high-affinity iron transporter
MLATALIIFREVLEAALIIGIVLAASRGVAGRIRWTGMGVAIGLAGAVIVAMFADVIASAMSGVGQEVFNATVLLSAVAMLAWHNVWMQQHGKELASKMRTLGDDVMAGRQPLYMLAAMVSLAVLREGAEVVLFMHGLFAGGGTESSQMLVGGVLGIVGGALVGIVLYFGIVRIPLRHLFRVTTWLLTLLAAGLTAQAVLYLEQAGLLPSFGSALWNTSTILSEHSVLGQVLHVLVGYTAAPDAMQLTAYVGTVLLIAATMWMVNSDRESKQAC